MYYPMIYNREDMHWFYAEAKFRMKQICKIAIKVRDIRAWLCFKRAQFFLYMMRAIHGIAVIFGHPMYNLAAWKYRETCEEIDDILNDLKGEL